MVKVEYIYTTLYMRKTSRDLGIQLAFLYADKSRQFLLTGPNRQQQKGSFDCGLLSLTVTTGIAACIDPEHNHRIRM